MRDVLLVCESTRLPLAERDKRDGVGGPGFSETGGRESAEKLPGTQAPWRTVSGEGSVVMCHVLCDPEQITSFLWASHLLNSKLAELSPKPPLAIRTEGWAAA